MTRPLRRSNPSFRRAAGGFTLVEIVIVIVLIGGILAIVASKIMGGGTREKVRLTGIQLDTLASKIETYESDVGTLPESLDALVAAPPNTQGWLGPYARAADLKDLFGTPIQYRKPGDNDAPYQLVSLAADKKQGGEGVDADIVKPTP
jgi:general secretion pathway protein G